MFAQRSVTNDDELRFAMRSLHFLECFDQRRQAIPRIESAEEKNDRNVVANTRRRRDDAD